MLGLVHLGPRHGYEIAAHFGPEGDLGMVCQLPMSLLYAQLKRLESLGYIGGTTEVQANRPPRRVYSITPEGQAEFWRWLDQPVSPPPRDPSRFPPQAVLFVAHRVARYRRPAAAAGGGVPRLPERAGGAAGPHTTATPSPTW